MVEFGEQLRRAREAKGMTQQSLAEQLYVTRQSVSRWECGDRYPDLLTTKKISQILDVSLDDLLSGKEMTKVVERNPVIEKKAANNIMIVLYAFVVLSYVITIVDIAFRLPMASPEEMNYSDIQLIVIQITGLAVSIAAFLYGLINAVRGTLSPKRMGAVLVAYFVTSCIIDFNRLGRIGMSQVLISSCLSVIAPCALGAIASFFFFIRKDNRKIWISLIAITSVWGILRTVMANYAIVRSTDQFLSMNLSTRAILSIAIYGLILYQTFTLDKKRKNAIEVSEVS